MSDKTVLLIDVVIAGISFWQFARRREVVNLIVGLTILGFILGFFK
jgi:hypothetical protein